MVSHARRSSKSRRHCPQRPRPAPLLPLAVLDLSKPGERQAHDFLCRATSKRDRMWTIFELRRQDGVLLCAVRWVQPDDTDKSFALAEVSLTETAVYWRNYATAEAARAELARRCAVSAPPHDPT